MPYSLRRLSDGAGDSGPMSRCISPCEMFDNSRPKVGYNMVVGSFTARSYQKQDYWITTPITEIIEDTPFKVVFRTHNSVYEWTCD